MKRASILIVAVVFLGIAAPVHAELRSFDRDWRFCKGDAKGAEQSQFDDASWKQVNVPHDWAIERPFDESAPERGAGAFLRTGVGWYRKHFARIAMPANGKVFIDFQGVMANSDIWINGHLLGHRPYGYSSFQYYDLTPYLQDDNVLAVRCDNSEQPASRWYAGAGIYRHVQLNVTDATHFEHWSNFITTPKVSVDQATMHIKSVVMNESDKAREVFIAVKVFKDKEPVTIHLEPKPRTIEPGKSKTFDTEFQVDRPQLWGLNSPNLYQAVVDVVEKQLPDAVRDEEAIPFGIRRAEFKPDTGFWLNGKNLKLKGVCVHGDGGAFGVAVPSAVWERRLKALKELGANAIRTAHNPPDPDFLDVCDRMGFVVMDEAFDCWTVGKNPYDYHLYFNEWFTTDARDMVLRDRNHPSIILYSAGNEIHDTPKPDIAKPILRQIVDVYHEADPTRPVTQALFRPNASHDYENGLAAMLDVVGTNYRDNELLAAHAAHPTWPIVGTENRHDLASWLAVRDNPEYSGQFLWTGVDYLGESRRWPVIGAGSGLIDRDALPKSRAWERQSWWSEKPMAKIARRVAPVRRTNLDPGFEPLTRFQSQFCDWTPENPEAHDENVEVYSNCESVELFLNGKSLGALDRPKDDSPRKWKVSFEPGSIKAVAKNGGNVVATDELKTAGKPAKVLLVSDRDKLAPKWENIAYVQATIVDETGVPVPRADNLVKFDISGSGAIAAVDNADNASHESFRGSERHAYQGVCFAMVKATGDNSSITVKASAKDLEGASLTIEATK